MNSAGLGWERNAHYIAGISLLLFITARLLLKSAQLLAFFPLLGALFPAMLLYRRTDVPRPIRIWCQVIFCITFITKFALEFLLK